MLYRKTRSRSWKGVAVLGALPHFVRCVCQVPTPFQRSYATAYAHPLTLSLPVRLWRRRAAGKHKCVVLRRGRDGASGTGQEFVGRWSECVGICYFQTVGSASALSEHTSRSEAVNLVSATHFHERSVSGNDIYHTPTQVQHKTLAITDCFDIID